MMSNKSPHWAQIALLILIMHTLASMALAQPPDAPGPKGTGAPLMMEDEPILWDALGDQALKPDDPLVILRNALREHAQRMKNLETLSSEQDVLSDQLRLETARILPGRPTLPEIPKLQERRRLVAELHRNAQAMESEEAEMRKALEPLVANAEVIRQRLGEALQEVDQRILNLNGNTTSARKRFLERQKERMEISRTLLESVQANPNHGIDLLIEGLRKNALYPERRGGPSLLIMEMRGQLENLEREQLFLKQRLQNHEETLRSLQTQIDQLAKSQQAESSSTRED